MFMDRFIDVLMSVPSDVDTQFLSKAKLFTKARYYAESWILS